MVIQTAIEADILEMLEYLKTIQDSEQAKIEYCKKLSSIIYKAILSATVNVPAGIVVQVAPVSGTGATTSIGLGTLS